MFFLAMDAHYDVMYVWFLLLSSAQVAQLLTHSAAVCSGA